MAVNKETGSLRQIETLDYGWKFKLADAPGIANADFDDSEWETVRVPHDWAIRGPFNRENDIHITTIVQDGQKTKSEHTGRTGGLPHVGRGWYRLQFNLPENIASRRTMIEFDGVMSHSKVYCNGKYAGSWPYGYSSFAFDLTDFVMPGRNILAVSVDNKPLASRWYPGAGIYRNVRLVIMSPLHVTHWGTYVTTPSVKKNRAEVDIRTTLENHTGKKLKVQLETRVIGPDGKHVKSITGTKDILTNGVFRQHVSVNSPVLWSVNSPGLYRLQSLVKSAGRTVDCHETTFGIRLLKFDAEKGFFLNGEHVYLKGVCMHHDLGPLGIAVNREALRRQLSILQDMGCNAIRTSHNPPAPELLELADRMGFLVIDEAFDEWRLAKCKNGYNILFDEWAEKDLRAMIRRDRNHPSVIMWSIGNEIPEQGDARNGAKTAAFLHNICREEDPTRPTTSGFNSTEQAIRNRLAATVDIPGWNYASPFYAKHHSTLPGKPMYGSETASSISTRGEYYFPVGEERNPKRDTLQVNSYDLSYASWGLPPDVEFRGVEENPFIMGEFVWSGFDYLGEPTPYCEEWPSRSSYFGIVDLCGIPKDRFYLYQSSWAEKGTLHLLPHWTWPGREGEITPVHCYSSWDTVELFVNGVSQGVRSKNYKNIMERYRLVWNGVTYKPGEIRAVAYDGEGRAVKETIIYTAGEPAEIRLTPDREEMLSDGDDMAFICAAIVDGKNNLCPRAGNLIRFKIRGPAEIAGIDNGNPASTEPFFADYRRAFNGKCMLYLRSLKARAGSVTINAESEGLTGNKVTLIVK